MSAMMEATNNRGMLALTFRSLDVAFPVMYPKAKWPTANVSFPSYWLCVGSSLSSLKLNVFVRIYLGILRAHGFLLFICGSERF
jgi:hypothetical protein